MGDKTLHKFFVSLVFLYTIIGSPAFAQQDQAEESDIAAVLGKMTGSDPIQRAIATQDALGSSNQILRSMALNIALASSDQEVREAGLVYLATQQKDFIITISAPPSGDSMTGQDTVTSQVINDSPIHLSIDSFDQNSSTFKYSISGHGSGFAGAVTRDGLSFYVPPGYINNELDLPCQVDFRGVANGLMIGALTCGSYSFPVTTPVP